MKGVEIKGVGVASPERLVESVEIDRYLRIADGSTELRTGIRQREYVNDETAGELGVKAAYEALKDAGIDKSDLDCIISASGTMEQAIPYNGARLHKLLKLNNPTPAFDVNMTCLSAVAAIDVANSLILSGTYNNILVVSSEVASVGLDWNDLEVGGMFGDGAAALVIGKTENEKQRILASHFETYSEGYDFCQIRGGGSLMHPRNVKGEDYAKYGLFEMQGKDAYRLTAKVIPSFMTALLSKAGLQLTDVDWVVPHQASKLALEHLQKRLEVPKEKLINILSEKGNQIAASIPIALHELFKNRDVRAGDRVMIIGTSAGLSLGGIILEL